MGMMGYRGGIGAGLLAEALAAKPALGGLAGKTPREQIVSALFGGAPKAPENRVVDALFRSSDFGRRAFTEQERVAVWTKGRITYSLDAANWRYDAADNLISWDSYGDADSTNGWEIDHILSVALGGSNHISNLRPLHCKTNRSLGGALGGALNRNPFLR